MNATFSNFPNKLAKIEHFLTIGEALLQINSNSGRTIDHFARSLAYLIIVSAAAFILDRHVFCKANKNIPNRVENQKPDQMVTTSRLFYTLPISYYSWKNKVEKNKLFY